MVCKLLIEFERAACSVPPPLTHSGVAKTPLRFCLWPLFIHFGCRVAFAYVRLAEDADPQTSQAPLVECKLMQLLWKTVWQNLMKLNIQQFHSQGRAQEKLCAHSRRLTGMLVFILPAAAKPQNNPDAHQPEWVNMFVC